MQYLSTRAPHGGPTVGFDDVLLSGLAPDGGLYLPGSRTRFDPAAIRHLRGLDYPGVAGAVLRAFVGPSFPPEVLNRLLIDAYRQFSHPAVAPLKQIGTDEWLLELFHGPTLAFKDYALQVVGRMFDHLLALRGERLTIIGATSGDTGSAAIEACRDRAALDVFILFPQGRVSEVQRRQMTTVTSANVHAIAVEGTFDDCQDLAKALFADAAFRERYRLGSVNSINWARIAAQIAYYFWAALSLGAPEVPIRFAVPTGNFGNIYAGYMALSMGLPIDGLTIGTNRNDILWRFMRDGEMRLVPVEASLSPSMDIQVSSNFERLYYKLVAEDGRLVAETMTEFRRTGLLSAGPSVRRRMQEVFTAHRASDEETEAVIGRVWRDSCELVDPHTAVAIAAMRAVGGPPGIPRVALACAHPAKFPDVVARATGIRPPLPPHLADLLERPERMVSMPNELSAVKQLIAAETRAGAGA